MTLPEPTIEGTATPLVDGLPKETPHRIVDRVARLLRAGGRDNVLALIDQGVVSGTNFIISVVVGRTCGPSELGLFSLGFTLLVLVTCIQNALVSVPYTMFVHREKGDNSLERAGSSLVVQLGVCLAAVTGLFLFALGTTAGVGPAGLSGVVWVLVVAAPFQLFREFGRKISFAHLQVHKATLLDMVASGVQLLTLGILWKTGRLDARTAFAAVGVGTGAAAAIWLYRNTWRFRVRWDRFQATLREYWAFGRWIFAGQIVSVAHSYAMHWMLAIWLSKRETGLYSACTTVVYFSNPVIQGLGNVLGPRIARAYGASGPAGVRSVVIKAATSLAALMAVFCVAVFFFGDTLLHFLYGAGFASERFTLFTLALYMMTVATSVAFANGLWALERPDVNFRVNIVGLVVTLSTAAMILKQWGTQGAALSLLAGNLASTTAAGVTFFYCARSASPRREAADD